MTTALVSRNVELVDDAKRMAEAWYRFVQELYQWSGLAGSNFPLYVASMATATQMVLDPSDPPVWMPGPGNTLVLDCAASVASRVHFALPLPRGYTRGTALQPFIRIMRNSDAAGDSAWEFEHTIASVGDVFGPSSVVAIDDVGPHPEAEHLDVIGESISGAELEPGAILVCSVRRNGAADTYADDVFLLGAGVYLQNSAHGTQTVP